MTATLSSTAIDSFEEFLCSFTWHATCIHSFSGLAYTSKYDRQQCTFRTYMANTLTLTLNIFGLRNIQNHLSGAFSQICSCTYLSSWRRYNHSNNNVCIKCNLRRTAVLNVSKIKNSFQKHWISTEWLAEQPALDSSTTWPTFY